MKVLISFFTKNRRQVFILGTAVFILLQYQLVFGAQVSAQYTSSGGNNIVLHLSVQSSSPANLIIEQYLNPSNKIVSCTPQASKISQGSGKVKWLFRKVKSGQKTVSIQLASPLQGNIRAMVRFRNPQTGELTELQVTP